MSNQIVKQVLSENNFLIKAWSEEPERDAVYILLDKISDDLSKIHGVKSAGSSDVDSYNTANINIELKPFGTSFHPNGQTYISGFDFNFRTAKNLISKIVSNHGASVISIDTPKKKYWRDSFDNSAGGYDDPLVHVEIQLPNN